MTHVSKTDESPDQFSKEASLNYLISSYFVLSSISDTVCTMSYASPLYYFNHSFFSTIVMAMVLNMCVLKLHYCFEIERIQDVHDNHPTGGGMWFLHNTGSHQVGCSRSS